MEHASATVNLWPLKGWTREKSSVISCKYLWPVSQRSISQLESPNITVFVFLFFNLKSDTGVCGAFLV